MNSLHSYLSAFAPHLADEGAVSLNYPLSALTTFRIGGVADAVIAPTALSDLCALVRGAWVRGIPYRILGAGSNLLAPDEGFCGAVFLTRRLNKISINENYVTADCGISLNTAILAAMHRGLGGLSALYGIPATVGGAVYMNAGAHGSEISRYLVRVEVFDAETGRRFFLSRRALCFSYRHSRLQEKKNLVLLRACFCLPFADADATHAEIREVCRRRCASQPLEFPSAGSAFRRPAATEAWRLLDAAGMRGKRIGGAEVSEKHAGFIINRGGATALDVRRLLSLCEERVKALFDVKLVREIEFL